MAKTTPLGVRFEPDVKGALEKAAEDDKRSLSAMVTIIVEAWLIERKYLPKPKR